MLLSYTGGSWGLDHLVLPQDGFTGCLTTSTSSSNSLSVALVAVEAIYHLHKYSFIVLAHLNIFKYFVPCIGRNQ